MLTKTRSSFRMGNEEHIYNLSTHNLQIQEAFDAKDDINNSA